MVQATKRAAAFGVNGRFKLKRGHKLFDELCRVAGKQIKRPDQISLASLKSCLVNVEVGTVTKNYAGVDLPEVLHYSVVRKITGNFGVPSL